MSSPVVALSEAEYLLFASRTLSEVGLRVVTPRILELYNTELQSLRGRAGGAEQQWAWMAANVKFASTATGEKSIRWLTLNASALDAEYYYYIPHFTDRAKPVRFGDRGTTPNRAADFDTVNRQYPVWRVLRARWGEAQGNWENNRALAEPVAIPGLTYTPPSPVTP